MGSKKHKKQLMKMDKNLSKERSNIKNKSQSNKNNNNLKKKKKLQHAAKLNMKNNPRNMDFVQKKHLQTNKKAKMKKSNENLQHTTKQLLLKKKAEKILAICEKRASSSSCGTIHTTTSPSISNAKSGHKNDTNRTKLEKMLGIKEIDNSKGKTKEPTDLRERLMTQLRASRFRYLNETLYNNESSQSKAYFKDDPDAFQAYHQGYRQQVEQWPLNPLDVIISSIKNMSKDFIIADFGCGEARLAASIPHTVHSFDLVSLNERVKACDVAHTPLLTNSVQVVVFCLSMMGTNLHDFIREANRVLKIDGILKIAEVESRFENIKEFIKILDNYGFVNTWKDLSHNLFYFLDFTKKKDIIGTKPEKLPFITLKTCTYKKR